MESGDESLENKMLTLRRIEWRRDPGLLLVLWFQGFTTRKQWCLVFGKEILVIFQIGQHERGVTLLLGLKLLIKGEQLIDRGIPSEVPNAMNQKVKMTPFRVSPFP